MEKRIKNIKELKALIIKTDPLECFISLNGGLRSSKEISYIPKTKEFEIFQSITGTMDLYTEKEMLKETNIGKALKVGALYYKRA